MDTGILEFSAFSREGLVYSKDVLLALEPAGAERPADDGAAAGPGPPGVRLMEWVVFAPRGGHGHRDRGRAGRPPEPAPRRALPGREPVLRRGAVPHAARGVPGPRPGHRLRGRDHGALHLRHHAADSRAAPRRGPTRSAGARRLALPLAAVARDRDRPGGRPDGRPGAGRAAGRGGDRSAGCSSPTTCFPSRSPRSCSWRPWWARSPWPSAGRAPMSPGRGR